jgi:hypothetical protein
MNDLKQFLAALLKRWWPLMSCAVFTALGLIAALSRRGNAWIIGGTALLAVTFLLYAAFGVWRDEHRRVLESNSKEPPPVSRAPEWQHLSEKFETCSSCVRADWHSTDGVTTWRLAGGYAESKPIEALCIFAGALLLKSPNVYAAVKDEVRCETEHLYRWLSFIKSTISSDSVDYGIQQDDAGNSLGVIVFGHYSGIAHTSALLCTRCSAQEL